MRQSSAPPVLWRTRRPPPPQMRSILLAARASRWLRILADRWDRPVSSVSRELRTAPALAIEVARLLDRRAREEAASYFDTYPPRPLPQDTDWLTRHHYAILQVERREVFEREQEQTWNQLFAAQEARKGKG